MEAGGMADMNKPQSSDDGMADIAPFPTSDQDTSFCDWLRSASEPHWTEAVEHPFTEELADNTLDREVYAHYLIEDLDFVDTLISVFGYAIGQVNALETKKRIAQFLAMVTSDENDFFERALEALDVPESQIEQHEPGPVNRDFQSFLLSTAREDFFPRTLAALLPVEWVYETWARRVSDRTPDAFYFQEWIELHNNPAFSKFVGHLRDRMNEIGPDLPPEEQQRVVEIFCRGVRLESAFFDAVYDG